MTKKPFAVRNGRPQAPSIITRPMNRHDHAAKFANSNCNASQTDSDEEEDDDDDKEKQGAEMEATENRSAEKVANAGTSEGAAKGWLTRRGGIRVAEEFDHEDGRKHVKLTIQGQEDGQKNVELNLPKETHAAIVAGQWKPDKDMEKHSKGEDFHTIHGYESVAGLRQKYGKGSEVDKINGIIGGQIARAKAYYSRARDFADGSEAQLALKAKAESILKEVNDKHRTALNEAKQRHAAAPVANRDYLRLLNSFRSGTLVNYSSEVQEMLDEVAEYAERGEALPWDLMADYEDWLEENA